MLRLERTAVERLTAADSAPGISIEVAELDSEESEEVDWMTALLSSHLFANIPATNLQRIFAAMEALSLTAGSVVVEQGTPGDYYYVIQRGRCGAEQSPRVQATRGLLLVGQKMATSREPSSASRAVRIR